MFEIGLTNSDKVKQYLDEVDKSEKKGAKSSKGWRLFVADLVYDFITMGPQLIRELIELVNSKNAKIEELEAKIKQLEGATLVYNQPVISTTPDITWSNNTWGSVTGSRAVYSDSTANYVTLPNDNNSAITFTTGDADGYWI